MSEKQMEKNLEYGDCFNFLGAMFVDLVDDLRIKIGDKKIKKN